MAITGTNCAHQEWGAQATAPAAACYESGVLGERRADCPNCGGPIEFGIGSSSTVVCPSCRYSVVRTDRDLSAVGRVADLVPTAPPIDVGDGGTLAGRGFSVRGRLQLDHGKGPWDEWYIAFDEGGWGWLARAQGQWYVTALVENPGALYAWQQLPPGTNVQLQGVSWVVQEQGTNRTLSGEGELPFPLTSGEQGWTVDLAGPGGQFATIDYGDGSGPPMLYVGRMLAPEDLQVSRGGGLGVGPPVEKVAMGKLECPSCGGPVEIRRPEACERLACTYCFSVLDLRQGNLAVLDRQTGDVITPRIPLGTEGTLRGESVIVAGFMERCTTVFGETFAWREYLLYTERGYRWLMEDNLHWQLLEPISPAEVRFSATGARYEGKTYRRFARNTAVVRFVVGEFYWKVEVGETTRTTDYVAPPRILSQEESDSEQNWSAGSYVEPQEVWEAFGLSGTPPKPIGVGPSQPNPTRPWPTAAAAAALFALLVAVAVLTGMGSRGRVLVEGPLALPATQTLAGQTARDPNVDRASYTPVFEVNGPTVLSMTLRTNADNDFVGVACALIEEQTGEVREFYIQAEYYHGVSGGESWSEGSRDATKYIDRVSSGRYSLRMDPEWNHYSGPGTFSLAGQARVPTASVQLREGSTSPFGFLCGLVLLLLPVPLPFLRRRAFEQRRWQNANP
jgi:hypothetical protein